MAKTTKKQQFKWLGYVNINIPESHDNSVQTWVGDDKNVFAEFNQCLIDDYTFKFYVDANTDSFKCLMTCYKSTDPNYGYALSAFSTDWYTSLAVVLYKHIQIAEREWDGYQAGMKKSYG